MSETFHCPHCHAEIPIDAIVCKHCGADDLTAWSSKTLYDGIDLPDEENDPKMSFSKTQLGKDLKYLILIILLLAFGALAFRI